MTNYRNLYKIMLFVAALFVTSFYFDSAVAKKSDETPDYGKQYGDYQQSMEDRDKAEEEYQKALEESNAYKNSQEYKDAEKAANDSILNRRKREAEARQEHKKYIEEETQKADAAIAAAQKAYDNCNASTCADALLALQKAHEDKKAAVAAAENNPEYLNKIAEAGADTPEELAAYEKKKQMDEELAKKQQATQTAKENRDEAVDKHEQIQKEGLDAADKEIKSAQKDKEKADEAYKKAEQKVKDACADDAASKKCQKAKEDLNEAKADRDAAQKRIDDAKGQKTLLTGEEDEGRADEQEDDYFDESSQEAADEINQKTEAAKKEQGDQKAAENLEKSKQEYRDALNDYNEKANALAKCREEGGNCEAQEEALRRANDAADEAYNNLQDAKDAASGVSSSVIANAAAESAKAAMEAACGTDPNSAECKEKTDKYNNAALNIKETELDEAQQKTKSTKQELDNAKQDLNSLNKQLNEAQMACEYSKGLTSKEGKEQAEMYCNQAEKLKKEVEAKEKEIEKLQDEYNKAYEDEVLAEQALNRARNEQGLGGKNQEFKAISTATADEQGHYIGGGDFTATGDIFKDLTRRAMRFLVGIKPLVYTLAGFGLIGFAWMAVFNKISWKWFSNIAMGLFLVANIGRFIEYFVFPEINGEIQQNKLSFDDTLSRGYADSTYKWVDIVSPYTPPEQIKEELPDTSTGVPEINLSSEEAEARKFCEAENPGGGLFGGGAFITCVRDFIAAGKNAAQAIDKAKDIVQDVKTTAQQTQAAVENIGNAVQSLGQGDIEDTIRALSQIGSNVNSIVGGVSNLGNSVVNNVSGISNDLQDMTKSRDEAAELQKKRNDGEATNALDAALKGQKLDENGEAERLWGGLDENGNPVEGKIAGNDNWITQTQDKLNEAADKSQDLNLDYQDGMRTAYELASDVGNTSLFGGKTINDKIAEKRAQNKNNSSSGSSGSGSSAGSSSGGSSSSSNSGSSSGGNNNQPSTTPSTGETPPPSGDSTPPTTPPATGGGASGGNEGSGNDDGFWSGGGTDDTTGGTENSAGADNDGEAGTGEDTEDPTEPNEGSEPETGGGIENPTGTGEDTEDPTEPNEGSEPETGGGTENPTGTGEDADAPTEEPGDSDEPETGDGEGDGNDPTDTPTATTGGVATKNVPKPTIVESPSFVQTTAPIVQSGTNPSTIVSPSGVGGSFASSASRVSPGSLKTSGNQVLNSNSYIIR